MKAGRAAGDPADELCQPGVGAQRIDRVIVAGKLGFRERGMDLVVADLVQQHRRPALAAAKPGREMVQALAHIRRDGPAAEGADGIAHGDSLA